MSTVADQIVSHSFPTYAGSLSSLLVRNHIPDVNLIPVRTTISRTFFIDQNRSVFANNQFIEYRLGRSGPPSFCTSCLSLPRRKCPNQLAYTRQSPG